MAVKWQPTTYTQRPDLGVRPPCDCAKKRGAYALAVQLGLYSVSSATTQGLYAALSRAGYVWDHIIGVWVKRSDWN